MAIAGIGQGREAEKFPGNVYVICVRSCASLRKPKRTDLKNEFGSCLDRHSEELICKIEREGGRERERGREGGGEREWKSEIYSWY